MSDIVDGSDPLDTTLGGDEGFVDDGSDDVEGTDFVAEVNEAIANEPSFETDDFDPRSDVHEQVFGLDESLTSHGGDATADHHGLHDLDDVGDMLGDIGDLLH